MTPVLSTTGLTVAYGGNTAVAGVDLEMQPGTMVGIVGANGAGKSSLLAAIAGWSRGPAAVSGSVRVDGRDISRIRPHRRAAAGVTLVPESRSVFYDLTVEENLLLAALRRAPEGRPIPSVADIYEQFPRLEERRGHKGSALSGGERQMLAIGRALRTGPRLLLLDEPSIGLAPMLVVDLLRSVRGLVDGGLSVLLAEQNVMAVLEVVDELCLFARGRLVGRGSPQEIKDDPRLTDAYLGTMA